MNNIKICTLCNGYGQIKNDIGTHMSDYVWEVCPRCKGTGRVVFGNYNYEVPFGTDVNLINRFDTNIFKLVRELETEAKK